MQNKMKFFCQETILYMYYVTIYINKKGNWKEFLTLDKMMMCVHISNSIYNMYNKFTTPILQSCENYLISLFRCWCFLIKILFIIGKLQLDCQICNIFRTEVILNILPKTLRRGEKYWQCCKMAHQLKLNREEDLNYTKNIYLNNYFIVDKRWSGHGHAGFQFCSYQTVCVQLCSQFITSVKCNPVS